MRVFEALIVVRHLLRTRWALRFSSRQVLLAWQTKQIRRFLAQTLPRTTFYRPFADQPLATLPVMDKAGVLQNFQGMNTAGIGLDQARQAAMRAEQSRDFSSSIGPYTVGLSSGTQGPQGVFLIEDKERAMWAGIMLARTLPRDLLCRLLWPFGKKFGLLFFCVLTASFIKRFNRAELIFAFMIYFLG